MKTATSGLIIDEVIREREAQHAKWGEQNHPDGTGPNLVWAYTGPASYVRETARSECQRLSSEGLVTFADILIEEVAEALAEDDPYALRAELIQVAAVAAQWIEKIDRDNAQESEAETVERMARVICAAEFPEVSPEYAWNLQFEDGQNHYRALARAAHLASRPPVSGR